MARRSYHGIKNNAMKMQKSSRSIKYYHTLMPYASLATPLAAASKTAAGPFG